MSTIPDDQFEILYKELCLRARRSLLAFLHILEPQGGKAEYKITPVHKKLAHLFQGTIDGKAGRNQAISMPPRHGKSQTLSVRAVAWYVAAHRGKVALTGFSYSLLVGFLKDIKAIWATPEFKRIFPDFDPIGYKTNTLTDVQFKDGACVQVRSAGSKLTGLGFNLLLVDDAHAGRAEAESVVGRKHVHDWFFADCLSRLEGFTDIDGNEREPMTLIIGTRWHPDDLIGFLTSEEYIDNLRSMGQGHLEYEVTNFTAICDDPDTDPLGRAFGDALCPQVRSRNFLEGQRAQMPAYEWESQFQGNPTTSGSDQVDVSKLTYIDKEDLPEGIEVVRGWDLAVSEKKAADFSSGGLVGYLPPTEDEVAIAKAAFKKGEGTGKALGTMYIIDVFTRKLAWAKMKPRMIDLTMQDHSHWNVQRIGIEGVSGFEIGVSEIRSALTGHVKVETKNPMTGGKLVRAYPWLNLVEAGRCYVVRGEWNKSFIDELRVFPDGCLVAGTLVTTRRGDVAIENVRVGDECLTRNGWRRVTWAGQTGVLGVITRFGITGTPDHPVLTMEGWKSLQDVREYDKLMVCEKQLHSMGIPTTATRITRARQVQLNTLDGLRVRGGLRNALCCIKKYGSTIMAKYLRVWKSITRTEILETTASPIWNVSPRLNTLNAIEFNLRVAAELNIPPVLPDREQVAILATRKPVMPADTSQDLKGQALQPASTAKDSLPIRAWVEAASLTTAGSHVNIHKQCSGSDCAVPVFDLTVEDVHEFFANGVLVHNSHDDQIDGVTIAFEVVCPQKGKLLLA